MIHPWRVVGPAIVVSTVLVAASCGSSNGPSSGDTPDGSGGPGDEAPPPPPGGFGESGAPPMADSAPPDAATSCAASEAQAKKSVRPVDIIFVIDNSLTMNDKIQTVEAQISTNLVSIIDAAKIDYRVIMLSSHGSDTAGKICIRAPLSGTTCSPVPAQPVETTRFFHHSLPIGSNDAWCVIINGLDTTDEFGLHVGGYAQLLRPKAFRVLIVITDDRVSTTCKNTSYDDATTAAGGVGAADAFDSTLTLPYQAYFGTKTNRNYVQHAIVGLTDFDAADKTKPWPPASPVSAPPSPTCPGAFNSGTGYQGLAIETGGLRYPVCGLDYSKIFSSIAATTITGAALQCEFKIPDPPAGQTLDLSTVVPQFTPSGGGGSTNFKQVANLAACAPNDFYIDSGSIKLCPATCSTVQADTGGAQLKILYGCDPATLPPPPGPK